MSVPLRRAVEASGWHLACLDGARTRAELHDVLARELGFPSYYGRNLDALHDCLRDLEGWWVVLWEDWPVLARHHPRTARVARDLLARRTVVLAPSPPG